MEADEGLRDQSSTGAESPWRWKRRVSSWANFIEPKGVVVRNALRLFKIRKMRDFSATSDDFAINSLACSATLMSSSFFSAIEQQKFALVAASRRVAPPSMWSSCQWVTMKIQTESAISTLRRLRYESAT